MKIEKIKLQKNGISVLSPLEEKVLKVLWGKETTTVREVHKSMKGVALTSVAVILDRLHKKNLVSRKAEKVRGGYRYIYSNTVSESDFARGLVERVTDKLIDNFGPVALSYFNERFSKKEIKKNN